MRVLVAHWPRFYSFWRDWNRFWMLVHLWAQIEDLERLCAWAKRKRLSGPRQHYRRLLVDTERRLHSHAIREPRLSRSARVLCRVKNVLVTPSHHKGAGAKYRSKVIYKKPKFAIM